MWLRPLLSPLSRLAANIYYRVAITGHQVPRSGPVILVANHPNSLVDPVLVAAAARRPLSFLAKAPLFHHPAVGFLVRGAGCVPVYRRVDDPDKMGGNRDMFVAVERALADRAAIALFPEGVSHSEPSLQPLKTGAARMALGAYRAGAADLVIQPVGLILPDRSVFRSKALVTVGRPIEWSDIAGGDPADQERVRALTSRIDEGIRQVTLNLERWEYAPLIRTAEEVWSATYLAQDDGDLAGRLSRATSVLGRLRSSGDASWRPLARRLERHGRRLRLLGLTARSLNARRSFSAVAGWLLRRLPLILLGLVALAGAVLFWPPYRLVGWWDRRRELDPDVRATNKLLGGAVAMIGWIVLASILTGLVAGVEWGLAVLVGMPLLGLATLSLSQHWRDSFSDARRYLLVGFRNELAAELRREQASLAAELDRLITQDSPSP